MIFSDVDQGLFLTYYWRRGHPANPPLSPFGPTNGPFLASLGFYKKEGFTKKGEGADFNRITRILSSMVNASMLVDRLNFTDMSLSRA